MLGGMCDHVSVEELARQQGIKPVKSIGELARPDLFESDEELDEFLADLYANRRHEMPPTRGREPI